MKRQNLSLKIYFENNLIAKQVLVNKNAIAKEKKLQNKHQEIQFYQIYKDADNLLLTTPEDLEGVGFNTMQVVKRAEFKVIADVPNHKAINDLTRDEFFARDLIIFYILQNWEKVFFNFEELSSFIITNPLFKTLNKEKFILTKQEQEIIKGFEKEYYKNEKKMKTNIFEAILKIKTWSDFDEVKSSIFSTFNYLFLNNFELFQNMQLFFSQIVINLVQNQTHYFSKFLNQRASAFRSNNFDAYLEKPCGNKYFINPLLEFMELECNAMSIGIEFTNYYSEAFYPGVATNWKNWDKTKNYFSILKNKYEDVNRWRLFTFAANAIWNIIPQAEIESLFKNGISKLKNMDKENASYWEKEDVIFREIFNPLLKFAKFYGEDQKFISGRENHYQKFFNQNGNCDYCTSFDYRELPSHKLPSRYRWFDRTGDLVPYDDKFNTTHILFEELYADFDWNKNWRLKEKLYPRFAEFKPFSLKEEINKTKSRPGTCC